MHLQLFNIVESIDNIVSYFRSSFCSEDGEANVQRRGAGRESQVGPRRVLNGVTGLHDKDINNIIQGRKEVVILR